MDKSILVATAQNELNELLRLNLEEGTDFSISYAQSSEEALRIAGEMSFPLAILDAELPQQPFSMFYNALVGKIPGIQCIIIPPENNPDHVTLDGIDIEHFLSRPFFKPDLIDLVEKLLESSPIQNIDQPISEYPGDNKEPDFENELAGLIEKGEFTSNIEDTRPLLSLTKKGEPETAADKLLQNFNSEPEEKSEDDQILEISLDAELEKLLADAQSPLIKSDNGEIENQDESKENENLNTSEEIPEFDEEKIISDADSEEKDSLLGDVLAQLNSQTVEETDDISGEEIISMENLIQDSSELQPDLVFEEVMAQLNQQAVEDTEEISENNIPLEDISQVSGPINKEVDNQADLVLEEVMAQLGSQALEETEEISEEELILESENLKSMPLEISPEGEQTDSLLQDVMAQLDSQSVEETEEISEDDIIHQLEKEPLIENQKEDSLLSDVMAQLDSQSVEETEEISEDDIIHLLEEEPLVENQKEDSLLSDVMAQLDSQSVEETEEISEDDIIHLLEEEPFVEHQEDDPVLIMAQLDAQAVDETEEILEIPDIAQSSQTKEIDSQEVSFTEMLQEAETASLDKDEEPEINKIQEQVLFSVMGQLQTQSTDLVEVLGDAAADKMISIEDESILDVTLFDPVIIQNVFKKDIHDINDLLSQHQNKIPAIAVLIVKSHQVLSKSGFLPKSESRDIVNALSISSDQEKPNDLVKYIRFASNQNEYILYGTPLGHGFFLGTINDSLIPVSSIRTYTQELSRFMTTELPARTDNQTEASATTFPDEIEPTSLQDLLSTIPDDSFEPSEKEKSARDTISNTWVVEEFNGDKDSSSTSSDPSILDTILEQSKDDTFMKEEDWALDIDISKDLSINSGDIFEGYEENETISDTKLSDEEFKEILNTIDGDFEEDSNLIAVADLLASDKDNLILPSEEKKPDSELSEVFDLSSFENVQEEIIESKKPTEDKIKSFDIYEFDDDSVDSLLEEDRTLIQEISEDTLPGKKSSDDQYNGFQSVLALAQLDPEEEFESTVDYSKSQSTETEDDLNQVLLRLNETGKEETELSFEQSDENISEFEKLLTDNFSEPENEKEDVKPHWAETVAKLKELTFEEDVEQTGFEEAPIDMQETRKIPDKMPDEEESLPKSEVSAQMLQSTIQEKIKKYDDQEKEEENARFLEDSLIKIIEEDDSAEEDLITWVDRNVKPSKKSEADKPSQIDLGNDFKLPWEDSDNEQPIDEHNEDVFSPAGLLEEEEEEFPTEPIKLKPSSKIDKPEPLPKAPFRLLNRASKNPAYSCVLIPQLENKSLSIDLARMLAKLLPELAKASGCKLLDVKIKPTYMLWSIQIPSTIPPAKLIRSFRQRTSKLIFSENPALKDLFFSGDFWAPGYLLVSGKEMPSKKTIMDFISKTRGKQDTNPFIK
ncbi:MAG: transposase [Anaerolineaceae bacterium]|nr:transposase [Anaerolineaceae bacterium]